MEKHGRFKALRGLGRAAWREMTKGFLIGRDRIRVTYWQLSNYTFFLFFF